MIRQISNFDPPQSLVPSSGFRRPGEPNINYATWCDREAARLVAKGLHAGVVSNADGECAVFTGASDAEIRMAREVFGAATGKGAVA